MNRIENGMHTINGLSTETHKSFPIHYGLRIENCLKSITTYFDCIKSNEINVSHLYVQKHVYCNK